MQKWFPFLSWMNEVILRDAPRRRWLLFQNPRQVVTAAHVEDVLPQLRRVERLAEAQSLHAAGFIAYEAAPAFDAALAVRSDGAFPLLWFGLYADPEPLDIRSLPAAAVPGDLEWTPSVTRDEYRQAIGRVREYIRAGDTYQVNYTLRLATSLSADIRSVFAGLAAAQDPPYGAYVATPDWLVCSASPELFFELDGDRLVSRPMKGTAPRGLTRDDDLRRAGELRSSEKDRAENVMIVDMVRNDLGRVAETGSVRTTRLFEVEQYPTVWQMTSTVRARTRCGWVDILRATFPPASITGAPKNRTMQIIAELETTPRRVYTGCIGVASPGRKVRFNVAIRTILVNRQTRAAEYGVGGGIVWDSGAESEWEECRTKARILSAGTASFSLLETMRWTPASGYWLLDKHLRRLAATAAYFAYPANRRKIGRRLDAMARDFASRPYKVRLLIAKEGAIACEAAELELPAQPACRRVCLASAGVSSTDCFLYHKTTQRRAYEQALQACPGYDDVILWNEKGEVTESTTANVIAEIDGVRYTPPIHCGLLAGTCREDLLERGEIVERVLRIEDLARASRLFLANSVRGLVPAALVARVPPMSEVDI